MITTYVAEYDGSSRPDIKKVLSASSGETLEVSIPHTNEAEVAKIDTETIFVHARNLVQYIKDVVPTTFITEKDDDELESWPIKNWKEIELAKNEACFWWEIAYYRDEPEEEEPSDV